MCAQCSRKVRKVDNGRSHQHTPRLYGHRCQALTWWQRHQILGNFDKILKSRWFQVNDQLLTSSSNTTTIAAQDGQVKSFEGYAPHEQLAPIAKPDQGRLACHATLTISVIP